MKKISALSVAMLLILSLVLGALAENVTFTTKYFTLDLPEGWIVETEDLESYSEEGIELLGYSGTPAMRILRPIRKPFWRTSRMKTRSMSTH